MTKEEILALAASHPQLVRLFAQGLSDGGIDLHTVNSPKSGFTYRYGIPPMYMSRTGKKAVRADMNGIVRMMSQSGFFNASGGYYTYDSAIAEAIGGYPYGAILRWKDPATGLVRTVRSLKSDNKDDFVADPAFIDGVSWSFADMVTPTSCRPRIFADWANRTPGFTDKMSTKIGLTPDQSLQVYTADRPCMLVIQAGFDESEFAAVADNPVVVWAEVRPSGDESFYNAGLLAYIPPVGSAYQIAPPVGELVDPQIESDITYTSLYSPGNVYLWLLPGDSVKLSANMDFAFSAVFAVVPLLAADEMAADSSASS